MATRAAARKRGRGSGPRLNDLQRLEILRRHQDAAAPVSLRQLARDFGVDEKTIRRVVAAAADIEARASSSAVLRDRASVHRRPTPRFPALETALAAWIDARARAREEISPSIVMDKAKFLARGMGIPPEHFKASWGWYDKFSKRYGLQQAFIRGKEAAAASGTRRATQSLQELHQIMGSYDPEWVFSVEESTLFYDALPLGDYNGEQEAQKRNRVTLVLSCNSTGRVTLPICMVGREKPPISAGSGFPVKYLAQDRAWLDRATFGSWYSTVFVPFVRQRTSKPVLLVVDGERPGHQGDFEDDGVRLVFLPPPAELTPIAAGSKNVTVRSADLKTWWSRPLQMGVVTALKAEYKFLLVQSALSYHNAPQEVKEALKASEKRCDGSIGGVHFGHAPTLLDAARLLAQAWSQVPAELLENCFARANLVPPSKLLAAPTPPGARQEHVELAKLHCNNIASKIEDMLVSSSFPAYAWNTGRQNPSSNVRDRVRMFMHLDDDNSAELQQQLRGEINEALNGAVPLVSASDPVVPLASTTISSIRVIEPTDPSAETKLDLTSQVRGLLLGITDIATQLRLLPQTGADTEELAPLQLEGCIAAADQIRHCIQTFDRTLHTESSEQIHTESSHEPARKHTPLRNGSVV